MHAYGTYSEWLESPAKRQGKQCQDCHMAPTGTRTNIAPGRGGIERDPATLASHHTPGGERDMLQRCLTLKASTKTSTQGRQIEIDLTAHSVGHRVPTGFVDRQLILVVTAADDAGQPVKPIAGGTLPASTGKWSGLAGMLYAKQLFDDEGRTPVPFWTLISKITDTRLHPEQPDHQAFLLPTAAKRATVQLWYRRFWHEVAAARGWTDNDILIHERTISCSDP